MGRILEALKQVEPARRRPADTTSAPSPCPPDLPGVPPDEAHQEIPFIEVGGRGLIVEASPVVLAEKPAAARKNKPKPLSGTAPQPLPLAVLPKDSTPEAGAASLTFHPLTLRLPLTPPRERFSPDLIAFHHPDHDLARQYRSLLANLDKQLSGGEPPMVLFTAAAPGAGKTTVVLNLAITWAKQEKKVVVVDAGTGLPGVAQRLGLPAAPGLGEVLRGIVPLQAALQETGQKNLHALAAGENGTGFINKGNLSGVLGQLRQSFDLVLVDAPAWESGEEMVALGSACDMVYLVLPQALAKTPQVDELLQAIPQRGCRLGGYILTGP